jgi:GNAT superfamily N-acetyltransferase
MLDDTLLGSAMLVAHDMDTRMQWTPWLAGVVVAPERRGRGIGATLAEHAARETSALGFCTLYLYTFSTEESDARAIRASHRQEPSDGALRIRRTRGKRWHAPD